jgi:hypothetical protein
MDRAALVPGGTLRDQLPSAYDRGVANAPDPKPSDLRATLLPVLSAKLGNVTAEVDGEKRTVRRGDLLEPNDRRGLTNPAG